MYNEEITVPYPYKPQNLQDVTFDDCLAWTDCYGYKIGQGVYTDQGLVSFKNSVVYNAAVGMGIDHKYGTKKVSNVRFENMDIEKLHGNAHGEASWLTLWVEDTSRGTGPIDGVYIKNCRARMRGAKRGRIEGNSSSSKITRVTFTNAYIWESTVPAKNLNEAWMATPVNAENVRFVN